MLTRRDFLLTSGAVALTGGSAFGSRSASRFLSAATTSNGEHNVAGFDSVGEMLFTTPTGFRGHEVVVAPDRCSAVVIARRPRTSLARIRLDDGAVVDRVEASSGRHFYGHGVYTDDGAHLLTTENDYEYTRGVVAVRDAATLRVVDEFGSYGIGPHEMRWLQDRRTLAIANGGIATHPDHGRSKLNIDQMQPNLVFVDIESRQLVAKLEPGHRLNSVRHIDVLADDRVVVAMQQEDESAVDQPLIALADRDGNMSSLQMPMADLRELGQYTASICVDRTSGNAIATCPRGNRITFWDAARGVHRGSLRIADSAGVCVDDVTREFVVTNGRGMIYRIDCATFELRKDKLRRAQGLSWDNHLTAV